jgi:hypothetical protein
MISSRKVDDGGLPREIFGIDFSGAVDAGKKIWIARGRLEGERLRIRDCFKGESLPDSGRDRDRCLAALVDFIKQGWDAAFGLDFPFGVPKPLIEDATWEEFVTGFPSRYESPEKFRDTCRLAAHGNELRRATDLGSRTPFAPYNIRLYRQTFFGISRILSPLVRDDLACVLPMQRAEAGKPWILEVCPASTLKDRGLYLSYKGRRAQHREARMQARAHLVEEIQGRGFVHELDEGMRELVVEDAGGDALDSVIAAVATANALRDQKAASAGFTYPYRIEGYVRV